MSNLAAKAAREGGGLIFKFFAADSKHAEQTFVQNRLHLLVVPQQSSLCTWSLRLSPLPAFVPSTGAINSFMNSLPLLQKLESQLFGSFRPANGVVCA